MKSIVEQLCEKAGVEIQPEVSDSLRRFKMIQDGSAEVEVLEFLYGLVRLAKPRNVLETGTYAGWSSAVMAYAMDKNNQSYSGNSGRVTTLELNEEWVKKSKALHSKLGINRINVVHTDSLKFVLPRDDRGSVELDEHLKPKITFDLLFLDSEPDIRFKELQKFYSAVNPGGFIMIHDLHEHLGLSNQTLHGMDHWPFGDFRPFFGNLIRDHQLTVVNFRTPRGFTLLQKYDSNFMSYKYLKGDV